MKDRIYIPPSRQAAETHLREALAGRLETMTPVEFMKAYCSLAYLYPGFHPDGMDDWEGPQDVLPVAREAWRRAEAGELNDDELYPYQATKAAISQARQEVLTQSQAGVAAKKR